MEMIRLPALRRGDLWWHTWKRADGVYLVPELKRRQKEKGDAAGSVSLTTVLSNPRAIKACSRYIDKDLNRCFTSPILSSPISEDTPYEIQRAQELNSLLGPKGSEDAVDIIVDLHNTTANMGLSIISYAWSSPVCFQIFKHLQAKITNVPVRLVLLNVPPGEAYSLESVAKFGISLEVGPQPQGVVRADIFNIMKQGVDAVLDWTEIFNSEDLWMFLNCCSCSAPHWKKAPTALFHIQELTDGQTWLVREIDRRERVRPSHPNSMADFALLAPGHGRLWYREIIEGGEVEGYFIQKSMDYPRDTKTGKPTAAVHPQLQDQDFCLLQRGDPLFLTFSGETLIYDEEEPLHPLFINEAAYYEGNRLPSGSQDNTEVPEHPSENRLR